MHLTIRSSGGIRFNVPQHELEKVLAKPLNRFRSQIRQIYLYLEDVNGPRGGIDKQCRCVLHLRRMPPVVIRDEDHCVHALIHRVADRATHTLRQKLNRKNKRVSGRGKTRLESISDRAVS